MSTEQLIPDEWLLSYSAGALSDAQALLVASHVACHPPLQKKVQEGEALGGILLDKQIESQLSPDLLDKLIDQLDEPEEYPVASSAVSIPGMPQPLADYLGKDYDELNWKFLGPGLKRMPLAKGPDGEKLWLLRAKGGTSIPVHDHRGLEMTLILTGSYTVDGTRYGPGDVELADTDIVDHQPMIDEGEDCICLVVTEAPIRLHSVIGRMMQPFHGL